jgi:hypothetical protein
MQKMWKDALENSTWTVRVGDLKHMLKMALFYRSCYNRLFEKKKKGEVDIKPKLEEMKPCCSSSLKD